MEATATWIFLSADLILASMEALVKKAMEL
jgi:hypothetical protein